MKNDSFFYSNLCVIVYSNMNKLKLTVFVVLMGWCMGSTAQKYTMSSNEFQLGLNLFENQKYSAAQQHFLAFLQSDASATREQKIDAEFYSALCALRLFNPDGQFAVTRFIADNPEYPRIFKAYFELGNYLFHEQ